MAGARKLSGLIFMLLSITLSQSQLAPIQSQQNELHGYCPYGTTPLMNQANEPVACSTSSVLARCPTGYTCTSNVAGMYCCSSSGMGGQVGQNPNLQTTEYNANNGAQVANRQIVNNPTSFQPTNNGNTGPGTGYGPGDGTANGFQYLGYSSGYGNLGNGDPGYGNQGYGNQGYVNPGYGNQGNGNQGYVNPGYGNQGNGNPGYGNQGNGNPGYGNQGNGNPGYGNQGNGNQGYVNPGYGNQGYVNPGYGTGYNAGPAYGPGNGNAGNGNTAYGNTGYGNNGNGNNGYGNTGYGNTGNGNTAYSNTAYANNGNGNTGYGNTGYGNARFGGSVYCPSGSAPYLAPGSRFPTSCTIGISTCPLSNTCQSTISTGYGVRGYCCSGGTNLELAGKKKE